MRFPPVSTRLIAALIAGGLAFQPARAQSSDAKSGPKTTSTSDLVRHVQHLVTDLGSKRRVTRESARRRLLALGPIVLEHLPAPSATKNAATRAAIQRIRRTLERTAATRSAQASRVTITAGASLENIIASITTQTGNTLSLDRLTGQQKRQAVAIHLNRVTYWEALDAVLSHCQLELDSSGRSGTLISRPEPTASGSVARSGPVRVHATARAPRPIPGSNRHLVPMRLAWQVEPRLRPLYLVCRPANFRATGHFQDNQTAPLKPRSPEATLELPLDANNPGLQLRLDFQSPTNRVPRAIELAGSADVWLAAGSLKFLFDGSTPPRPITKRRGGVAVVFTSARITTTGDGRHDATIDVTVQYESGGPSFESHRLWMLYNRAYLVQKTDTASARRVAHDRFDTPRLGNGIARLVYHFKDLTGPPTQWRFVYEAPTQIVKVRVPLEFARWTIPPARVQD